MKTKYQEKWNGITIFATSKTALKMGKVFLEALNRKNQEVQKK